VKIYLRTNVPVKDFTMPAPIRQVLYEIMPADPKQIEASIQEMSDAEGKQEPESPRSQEPEVRGAIPEPTARTEPETPEASIEPGNEDVEPFTK
jgi:hypothetical protein